MIINDTNDEEARVQTWIGDGEHADAEVFTASGSQLDVVAVVVMNSGLGQHGVVLDLAFTVEANWIMQMRDFTLGFKSSDFWYLYIILKTICPHQLVGTGLWNNHAHKFITHFLSSPLSLSSNPHPIAFLWTLTGVVGSCSR